MAKPLNKLWVPQPASNLYAVGGEAETIRDRFVRQYGEGTVLRSELQICLDLMMLTGVIKPQEFVEVLERKLNRTEAARRRAAGFDD